MIIGYVNASWLCIGCQFLERDFGMDKTRYFLFDKKKKKKKGRNGVT